MAIFKCKMCGGDLEIAEEVKVAECEYCGTKQTVPNPDNEKKVNLFNRANRLRMASEFDKAAGIYESIIAEFPEEAEAYWGLCLCNYGIEYVDDPATAKKIPTCHRASFESLQKDESFELALEYADVVAQKIYRDEAREIDRIMQEILAVSKNEKPYDVFICYKETDDKGERTVDSVLAYDIYEALTAKGFNVFFARVTLEDKLGMQYEPYIFAALNSAKVMLSIGTKYEYFHAVWVKNEWSRFLKLMAKDKSKVLIPCFKDIDAYDMPEEFKALQAQDLGKLGAVQDIVRGVEKLMPKNEFTHVKETVFAGLNANVDSLIKRGFLALEDGEWNKADEFFEQALNFDAERGDAYLGKLMVELCVKTPDDLKNCNESFENKNNYIKAIRFSDNKLATTLKSYIYYINFEKPEIEKKDSIYYSALELIQSKNENNIEKAKEIFVTIKDWRDSEVWIARVDDLKKDAIYENALSLIKSNSIQNIANGIKLLESIKDWRDSEVWIARVDDLEKDAIYKRALSLLNSNNIQNIESGIKLLESIKDWRDSSELLNQSEILKKECIYTRALSLKNSNTTSQLIEAKELLEKISEYKDAEQQIISIEQAIYTRAMSFKESNNIPMLVEAKTLLRKIIEYKDSEQQLDIIEQKRKNIIYNEALYDAEKDTIRTLKTAIDTLSKIEDWKDSKEKITEFKKRIDEKKYILYTNSLKSVESRNIQSIKESIEDLSKLGNYKDSKIKIEQLKKKVVALEKEAAEMRHIAEKQTAYRLQNVCQYCGGTFKGLFTKKCSNCGKAKDY